MSRNGSGVYSLPAGNPVVTGTTISSSWANTTLSDIATALTGSIAADGQTAMTGNLQMGNNKITGLAVATATGDALSYNQAATVTTLTTTGNVTIGGTLTLTGGLTLNGNVTVGDASTDTLTVNATSTFAAGATFSSTFAANGGTTLGDASGDALTINSSAVSIPNGLNFDSNTLVIDATNNRVGVGATSLTYSLEVGNGTADTRMLVNPSNAFAIGVKNGTNPLGGWIGSAGSGIITFSLGNGTETMRINSSGNLQINGANGSSKLNVTSDNAISLFNSTGSNQSDIGFSDAQTLSITTFHGSGAAIRFRTTASGGSPSERMRITADGNVGIGTSSPSSMLSVVAPNTTAPLLISNATTGSSRINGAWNSDNIWLRLFNSAGTETIRFTTNSDSFFTAGNVGIGSSTPSSTGIDTGSTRLFVVAPNSNSGMSATFIADSVGRGILVADQGKTNTFTINVASGLATIGAGSSGTALSFNTSGTEKMRIDANGNLGLGITTPVAYANFVYQTINGTNGAGIQLRNNAGTSFADMGINASSFEIKTITSQPMLFATNNTERMRLDTSGNLLVGKTSATANGGDIQVSSGITFPATQVAKSDANTLDDYEEGTWTPSLGGDTTYYTQTGRYTKVGNLVFIRGNLHINLRGTGSQSQISGLPFSADESNQCMSVGYFANSPTSVVSFCFSSNTGTLLNARGLTGAATLDGIVNVFQNGAQILFSGVYRTST
jgi:hypothetical protein